MKEMFTDFFIIYGIEYLGQVNEDIGDDDQEIELVGVGGDDDYYKFEYVYQFVYGVLYGVDDVSFRFFDRLQEQLGDGQVRYLQI